MGKFKFMINVSLSGSIKFCHQTHMAETESENES